MSLLLGGGDGVQDFPLNWPSMQIDFNRGDSKGSSPGARSRSAAQLTTSTRNDGKDAHR